MFPFRFQRLLGGRGSGPARKRGNRAVARFLRGGRGGFRTCDLSRVKGNRAVAQGACGAVAGFSGLWLVGICGLASSCGHVVGTRARSRPSVPGDLMCAMHLERSRAIRGWARPRCSAVVGLVGDVVGSLRLEPVCLWCAPGGLGPALPAQPGYPAHQRRRPAPSSAVRQDLAEGEPRSGALDGRRAAELPSCRAAGSARRWRG